MNNEGHNIDVTLNDALYIPSYPQSIFSVQAATERGASVIFQPDSAKLIAINGTVFNIEKCGKLYYLNACTDDHVNVSSFSGNNKHSLKDWHEILGHCNVQDVLKLENVVEGMHITGKREFECGICIEGT